MRSSKVNLVLALCAGSAIAALAGEASAQPANAAPEASQLPEVVVTAQKRSENLQEVPAQVNVVSSQELEQLHVTQLTDIGAYVPGLQVNSGGAPGQTILSLRGIAPIGPSATVGVYLDDTPVGSTSVEASGARFSLDLLPYDLQRLEILQGPQGTLYGANSIGGLIKYVLTQPDLREYHLRVGGDVFGVENAGTVGGGGRINVTGPIVEDKLAFLASYASENTPGYINNSETGEKDQNGVRQQTGRLALLWTPTPALSFKLNALLQKTDADNDATVALNPTTLQPLVGELTNNNYVPETSRETLQNYSGDINWDLKWAKLTSVTSYGQTSNFLQEDKSHTYGTLLPLFGFPVGKSYYTDDYVTNKVTEELRLASGTGKLIDWLVGGFYTHESTENFQQAYVESFAGVLTPHLNPLVYAVLPDIYREYAAFGDLTLHVTDKFDLAGGLRYAYNDQNFHTLSKGVLTGSADLSGHSSEGVVTYNFNPRYQITRDVLAYLRIASGYQAGGPNIPYPTVPPVVKSDTLTNYEVGLKSEFWDRRALLNIAAFYIDWNNIQVDALQKSTGLSFLENGGTAKSEGVSLDGSLRPLAGLVLSGNVTYTDAVLTQNVPNGAGLDGDRLPYIPEWSGSLQANYSWKLTSELAAHVGGGVRLVDSRVSALSSAPNSFRLGAYDAVDLDGDITYKQYTVRLFVKNAGDTRAYDFYDPLSNPISGKFVQVQGTVIEPRTVGLAIDAKF